MAAYYIYTSQVLKADCQQLKAIKNDPLPCR